MFIIIITTYILHAYALIHATASRAANDDYCDTLLCEL
jgi:hypothetical protein